jgi:aryl-alcohol dehydrogenase-like predicted oxidoreductase
MSSHITVPQTDISIYPLCLGGNVFGWSANKEESFAVLDAFYEAGGNFIDTADVYSEWKPGNAGGESEIIIGEWMKSRGNRDKMIIATKVAKYSKRPGLSPININAAIEESLNRLQTEYVDFYYAHEDDATVPLVDTLIAFSQLITKGKVRHVMASNYSGARLAESLAISEKNNLTHYVGIQNYYNLVARKDFETDVAPVVEIKNLASFPYFSLEKGFLSGKYRPGASVDSMRAGGVEAFLNAEGYAIIDVLDSIAKNHNCSISAVSLAWLRSQKWVTAPIASARTVEQLTEIMQVVELSAAEIAQLNEITAGY